MELNDNLKTAHLGIGIDCNFKSTKKLTSRDILDSVDKPKNLSNCMFPLLLLNS